MIAFNTKYFYFTLTLFFIEIFIALFINDTIIRPFIGDVLVVILIYCFVKTFLEISPLILAGSIFIFACAIEILQYFNFVNILGLQNNKVLAIVLGSTFDWKDILAYALGTTAILWLENKNKKI